VTWAALEAALGLRVEGTTAVAGGSINDCYRVVTSAGPIFVKTHADPPAGFFAAEADGLARLAQAGVRVPEVLGVADGWLALAWLEPGPPRFEEAGRALAHLHQCRGERHGLQRDNFMGAVPQHNAGHAAPAQSFAAFFRSWRIEPLVGALPARLRVRVDALDLEAILVPPVDGPRLVHGDLWSGNLLHAAIGPTFIDPAVHYGNPEQDLAMTRLFGGFPPAFEAAWRDAMGLARHPDQEFSRRVATLNLYPLLVHVRLFGGGYVRSLEAALDAIERP